MVHTHGDEEATLLRQDRADEVFIGEHQLALGMTRYVLDRVSRDNARSA